MDLRSELNLRKELLSLHEDALLEAVDKAMSNNTDLADDAGALKAMPGLLRDYPALLRFYERTCQEEDAINPEGGPESTAYKVGSAVTLYAIKAVADMQAFEGLELPRDLQ